jgi:MFS transporter, DHA2 family, multidrug resistance protein
VEEQLKRRWWVLGALAIGILAIGLDMTILNLALPVLATDLGASNGELQWFADAYNLAFAAALLPAGLLGDRLGRKRMLLTGLIIFGVSSLVCAYAGTSWQLITGRVFLGLGAALLVPLSMSIIPVLFLEKERPKAIATWMMANAFGIPLGPVVGGWLLDHYWWGSVFLINIPLILVALAAVSALLPESRSQDVQSVDTIGVMASSLGLIGVTYGVIEVGEHGWNSAEALTTIFTGLILLTGFIVWERKAKHPMVDPALFRSRSFAWGTVLATLVSFAMYGVLFIMPQFFYAINGVDALSAGLRLLPLVGGLLVGSQISDHLQARFGAKTAISSGFLVLAIGLAMGSATALDSSYGFASIWIAIVGLGIGFVLPAAMDEAMSALSAGHSGVGSALLMALRQIGGTMGVAVLGTVLSSVYRNHLDTSDVPESVLSAVKANVSAGTLAAKQMDSSSLLLSVRSSFVDGMGVTLWICSGIAASGIVIAVVFLRKRSYPGKELHQTSHG